ncbi:hypothetical protein [Lacticaseibacillus saniviri]
MQEYQKNNKPEVTKESDDLQFMRQSPVAFFVLEYGALLIANYCGFLLGVILCVIAFISGNRYRKINSTHGAIMMVLSAFMFVAQF